MSETKFSRGLAGRPPKNAQVFLARTRPILAARWVRAARRAVAFLNDPDTKIDKTWVAVFNSLGDRLGVPRRTEQSVAATTVSATLDLGTVADGLRERMKRVEVAYGKPIVQLLAEGDAELE